MIDWNVVVTVQGSYTEALDVLRRFGDVSRTSFFNVLLLQVPNIEDFLDRFDEAVREAPTELSVLSRILPVTERFHFQSRDELESKAHQIALGWSASLAGKSFHVRMHRRGFKGRIHKTEQEQQLGAALLEHLEARGAPARLDFDDPDAVLAIETVGSEAGLSLWQRADLERHPSLRRSLGLEEKARSKELEAPQDA